MISVDKLPNLIEIRSLIFGDDTWWWADMYDVFTMRLHSRNLRDLISGEQTYGGHDTENLSYEIRDRDVMTLKVTWHDR
jgi:hypothetical protein